MGVRTRGTLARWATWQSAFAVALLAGCAGAAENEAEVGGTLIAVEVPTVEASISASVARPEGPPIVASIVAKPSAVADPSVPAPSTTVHADDHGDHTADSAESNAATVAGDGAPASSAAAAQVTEETTAGPHPHHTTRDAETMMYGDLQPDTKAQVDEVIAVYADRYATGADAQADGWMKATMSLYGIGAHYVRTSGFVVPTPDEFDIMEPNILLFDGEGPDAKFAGLSYVTDGVPEVGFVGDIDTWHGHDSVCMADGGVASLIEENSDVWLSADECLTVGRLLPLAGGDQMMHLWIGPGYIDSGPIMAHDHPLLVDGYHPRRELLG